ncbi:MAG: carboxypeptidase-like regulatory domain-containing protein [Flavobacteriales bacterium]
MKRYIHLLIGMLLAIQAAAQTQNTGAVRGTVVDKQSQYPLFGVQVVIVKGDSLFGGVTDENGRYRIEKVPTGRVDAVVKMVGYDPQNFKGLLLNSGKDLELNIQLEESVSQLGGVEIIAEDNKSESINKMSSVSSRSFSIDEAMRYSGTLQDPSRMAQNYAGVSGSSDDRNDIIIRGNSPTGVLWRLEGIDIPSPNHFATVGTTGGPISLLNINNLANSDFATSAFSADYGNALSGVFDLRLRSGNQDKREYLFQMGFNGWELGAEGPFKKGGQATYIINARYSFLEIMNKLGINFGTGSAIPEYQDVSFKVDLPTKKAGKFSVFGIGGNSFIDFQASDDDENNLYSNNRQNQQFTSTTGVVGISHSYFFNEKTQGKAIIALSTGGTEGFTDTLDVAGNAYRYYGVYQRQNKLSGHYFVNSKRSARNTLKAGVMYDLYMFNIADSVLYDGGYFFKLTDYEGDAGLMQGYAIWQNRPNEKVTLTSGLHSQYFLLNNSVSIEPRLGARLNVRSGQAISVGVGLHSQLQPIPTYFSREELNDLSVVSNNKNLDFNKAAHAVIGYDIQLSEHARLKSEVYYQYLYNIAVDKSSSSFSMLNTGATFTYPNNADLVNNGTGYNYGLEVTVERFLHHGFYYLFTTSLFESKYKGSDGVDRNTAFNGNYVFNFLMGKEWKVGENAIFSLDTKFNLAGGRRYTPIDLEASIAAGEEVRPDDLAYSEQYTPYARWDVKVGFKKNHKKFAQSIALDIRNVTGRENIFMQSYNARTKEIETTYQTGFFPVVLYSVYF